MAKKQTAKNKKHIRRFLSPSHTRGYYRFSKDFPAVTDSEGYRDNELIVNSPAKKASLKRRLIALFVCVFAVTFVVTSIGFAVSKIPVSEKEESQTGEKDQIAVGGMKAVYLSGDVLSFSAAESLIGLLRVYGVNTVVIDFKDASGNFYYKPSINVSNEALYKASDNAQKIVNDFKEADIAVFARFACFADDIYARNHQNEAAYVLTASGEENAEEKTIWYSGGNDSHAWLNPYSAEVQYYLRVSAEDIQKLNVDGIIFDYTELPVNAKTDNVQFAGQTDADASSKMSSFISLLNNTFISCKTATVVPVDVMLNAINGGETPEAFTSNCDYVIPDARLSLMPDNAIIGNRQYAKPSVSPSEFITDYINGALKFASGEDYSVEIVPLIEASETSGKQIGAIASSASDAYIMFSSANDYTAENFVIR